MNELTEVKFTTRELYHLIRKNNGSESAQDFFRRRVPYNPINDLHHKINRRWKVRQIFDRCQIGGQIGVIRAGMDCDCTQYHYESVQPVPTSIVVHDIEDEKRIEWLDGPESVRYLPPDQVTPRSVSRDRAMEAYEDGHAHRITWGNIDD